MSETAVKQQPEAGTKTIAEIIRDLAKPIRKDHLETKNLKGTDITFLPWYRACDYLDYYAPGWNYEVTRCETHGVMLLITVRLSIPALDGLYWREATGNEEIPQDPAARKKLFGDEYSNAESMALRRSAAKFGLARALYY